MNGTYVKLVGIATAVATLTGFVFSSYNSKDGLIREGVDRIKEIAQQYRTSLEELQEDYNELEAERNSLVASLTDARDKLETIYEKITGEAWDEENGDILAFDFNSLVKDGEQFENNVDGNAIAEMLGLQAGATTGEIIAAIQNLQDTIATLNNEIDRLEQEIIDLEAEIATYDEEQNALVEEINGLKAKLEAAEADLVKANTEEQAQLDYINGVINELEGTNKEEQPGDEQPGDPEEDEPVEDETPVSEYVQFELVGDWSQATEEQKTLLLNTLNDLQIKNDSNIGPVELTCKNASYGEYSKVVAVYITNEEVYNAIISHELYSQSGFRFNLSGQMISNDAYSSLSQSSKGNTISFTLKTN